MKDKQNQSEHRFNKFIKISLPQKIKLFNLKKFIIVL